MQTLRFVPVALAAVIAGALACGGDSSGPGKQAASVTGVAGDSQVGPTGASLDLPLSMTLLDSDGQPIQGVSVTWSAVPAGGASFSPQPSVSDVDGIATTTVTMGSVEDTIVINATVPGVSQPVVYHVLAVEPCHFARLYTIGAAANGVLTTHDCQFPDSPYYTDLYLFTVGAQAGVTATMSASTFDAWLDSYRGSGPSLAANNNFSSATTNAQLELILAPGIYVLGPSTNAQNATGAYTLSSAVRPQTLVACAEAWVSAGVTISDNLATTDCIDIVGTGLYYDQIGMIAFPTDTLTFTARSTVFDPSLTLYRIDQTGYTQVAFNDDSAATTTAFINYAVTGTTGAIYVLTIGSPDTAATGAYTLIVDGSASIKASPMLAPGVSRLRSLPRDVRASLKRSQH